MKLSRAIVFVDDVATMKAFYAEVLGMAVLEEDDRWVNLDGGVALHALPPRTSASDGAAREDAYTKLAFFAADVAAERARLTAAGARMGEVKTFDTISLCDGMDPEGNVFQISNRT